MPDPDLQRTQELAEEEGWKRCHQCHAFVEHREACQHMTCRCGAEFCYVCGARWRTCACNMEQLHALKQAAEVKRQARDLRQTQEEAETAEALRLVEEFEREEERKTILLRLERQRVEQERREKQLRERLHKEEERREAVKVTYQELRQILDSLHDRQQAEVVRDHGKEESILTHSAQALMTALVEGNKAERRAVVADGDRKLTDMIVALEIEYNNRVEQEREVEEEYRRQLCAYWAGKEDGDAQIQAELLRLRHRMDQGYSTWEKWMQNEVGTQRFLVQEEQTIKLELMDETEKRLTQESKQAQRAFVRNKQADLSWVEVIIHERQDMLRLLEEDDLGNGDDMADLLGEGEGEVGGWGDVDELDEYPVPGAFR